MLNFYRDLVEAPLTDGNYPPEKGIFIFISGTSSDDYAVGTFKQEQNRTVNRTVSSNRISMSLCSKSLSFVSGPFSRMAYSTSNSHAGN